MTPYIGLDFALTFAEEQYDGSSSERNSSGRALRGCCAASNIPLLVPNVGSYIVSVDDATKCR
jgi:hypothetical protein